MNPDDQDRTAYEHALQTPWLRQVMTRRWREPLTLRLRARRALEMLRRRNYPPDQWARRHAVIVDALSAHALATCGRGHWLENP